MPKWTDEQKAAIDIRKADLLVSAAAGSGKTAVLVERITRLMIEDQVGIDQMLIVTYTNAAAGEMRGRIEEALAKALVTSPQHRRYLTQQIRALNRAHIKTFHAFCLDMIRNHFHLVDVDPGFKLMNDSERVILLDEVMEETMEAFYQEGDEAFIQMVEAYSGNRDDSKLRQMLLSLYHFIQSQAYPMKWLSAQLDLYENENHPLRNQWIEKIEDFFKAELKAGIKLIDYGIDLCLSPGGPAPYAETLSLDKQQFEHLLTLEGEAFALAVSRFKFSTIKRLKKGEKEALDPHLVEEVKAEIRDKAIKKQIFEPIKQFYQYKSFERFKDEITHQAPLIDVMIRFIDGMIQRLTQHKRKRNQLDFNDLEHLAIKILESDEIAKQYQQQFEYVFVDEYQDASGIQETILSRIKRANNLFMVGDIKQSIYKFRLADPKIFIEKYKAFTRYEGEPLEADAIRVDLKKNFRTRDTILGVVNDLFSQIMSEQFGEVDYDEHARLNPGMAFEKSDTPSVEVHLISKSESDEDSRPLAIELSQMKNDEIEARAIAHKIKQLIGTPLFHPKKGTFEPCRYKDIVILIRSSKSWTPIFETVFLEEGIPFYADSNSGYFDALEIQMMLALIKVIANPLLDIELLTVLRSPVVGLTVEEMAILKLGEGYLYDALLQCEAYPFSKGVQDKIKRFCGQLETWRHQSTYLPIDDFIWELMTTSGLYDYVMAMPGGGAREANMRLLVDRASQFKNADIASLSQFVRFIEALDKSSGDMGVANSIGESEDVVRLMSFHKSKGLEFPVVICAGMSRAFNLLDTRGDLMLHESLGIGLSYIDIEKRTRSKTLPQLVMKQMIKMETLSEEMRVLYVGLTRPVDKLILFGTYKDVEGQMNLWHRGPQMAHLTHAKSFLDWIMSVWINHQKVHVVQYPLSDFETMSDLNEQTFEARIDEWYNSDYKIEKIEQQLTLPEHNNAIFVKSKVSVSDLKKGLNHFEVSQLLEAPVFMEAETQLTSAQKGTLVHLVLEHIDYQRQTTCQQVEALIATLIEKRILTEEEASVVDVDLIDWLIQSPLGQQLREAEYVYKETPFVLKEEGQLVQGIIDLYFKTDQGVVLVDYKTDQFVNDETFEAYKEQLRFYKKAIEKITRQKVYESYLVFLSQKRVWKTQRL